MAKPEWGLKRTCLSCGAKFYDFKKNPIVCPKCEAVFDPDAASKLKRGRQAPESKDSKAKASAAPASDESPLAETTETARDSDDVLEDASDLGDDAVPGVAAGDDEEEES